MNIHEKRASGNIGKVVLEEVNETVNAKVFCFLHRPVIRESAETAKVRFAYNASAKANQLFFNLNECLEIGLRLQKLAWAYTTV